MTCNYRWMSDVRWSSGKQDWHYNKQVSLKTMAICDTKLAPLTCTQKIENQQYYIYLLTQTYNYYTVQSFVLFTFLPAHTPGAEEQETKYCKWWHGKVTLLTTEKLVQITLTSVWLEFLFYKINFKIN